MSAHRPFRSPASIAAAAFVLLAAISPRAAAQIDAEAAAGAPFGVGRISVRLADGATAGLSGVDALQLTEANGRILYPARNAGLLNRLADNDPSRLTVMFLFRGDESLDVTLQLPERRTVRVVPGGRPRAHQRLLRQWWRQYNAAAKESVDRGGYPAIVDHYLVAMLARRLNLEPTVLGRKLFPSADAEQGLGLLLGTQSMHAAVLAELMLDRRGGANDAVAEEPLPPPVLPPLLVPEAAADVRVESIAQHVPEECYYIRFGSWANYRWMRDLMNDFGGDLGNMISERGLDFDQSGRMETQLALRETAIGNLLGSTAISDVAMIGMDMFYGEGAAVGMLFEARNSLFGNDVVKQREAAKESHPDAKLSTVKIAGRDVSLLRTPDNRVRSFYAVDGDYHLVTTSEAMVRRFYEAAAGKRSLGRSAEFRHARSELPTNRNDTIFAYLSDAFLRNLASPHYRIEMARRLQARVEMDVLTLARHAAAAEGVTAESTDELARGGFLPEDFGVRADGSRIVVTRDGTLADSLRGDRGSFLPVPDVGITRATRREVADYAAFADAYRAALGRVEPIIFAIRRRAGDQLKIDDGRKRPAGKGEAAKGELETLSIEARVSPFTGKTYETIAQRLGPPTKQYVAPLDGNLISVSAHLRNGSFGELVGNLFPAAPPPDAGSRLLFVGLDDFARPVAPANNFLGWLQILQQATGYVGSWPEAGMLARMLGLDEPLPENEVGYRGIFAGLGMWGLKLNEFTVVALHKEDLFDRARQLRVVESDRPAQIRLRVGDLTGTNAAYLLTRLGYQRTWGGSTANARYLHHLAEQLHIPRADARPLAEKLCGAKLICPLGGEYKVTDCADGLAAWVSTAWQDRQAAAAGDLPEGYAPPPLVWFRGLDADAALEPGRFTLRADLVVERDTKGGLGIPSLFGN